jgi:NADPH2:quinone reductase
MQLREIDLPAPSGKQVLVNHSAVGVNFVDLQHRAGQPFPVGLPLIPGVEAAGTVVAVGSDVSAFQPGDRVAYVGYMGTVYAEYGLVPEERLLPVPAGVALPSAAATLMQGMTAHMLTHAAYRVQAGNVVFIQAAGGGVGVQLIQMAKWLGATVLGAASTAAKAELARQAGADHVFIAGREDVLARARALTGGRGVDVVYDAVGRATFEQSLALLRPAGTLAVFGLASGPVLPFDINRLSGLTGAGSAGSLFLTWPTLNDYTARREDLLWHANSVFEALSSGRLQPFVADTFPLSAASEAHRLLERRQVAGKLILQP